MQFPAPPRKKMSTGLSLDELRVFAILESGGDPEVLCLDSQRPRKGLFGWGFDNFDHSVIKLKLKI